MSRNNREFNSAARALQLSRPGSSSRRRPVPIERPELKRSLRPKGPPGSEYLQIFQKCVDDNIVGRGSYHVILKDQIGIPPGYYCRIGFMHGTRDRDSFDVIKKKRLEWSRAMRGQSFCIPSEEAGIYIPNIREEDTLEYSMKTNRLKKHSLRLFYEENFKKGNSALFGEMVKAAEGNVRQYLDSLNLTIKERRQDFIKTLTELHSNVKLYIKFVISHFQAQGWSSFTFDLKASNALMCLVGGTLRPVLCDLDAEEANCFSRPTTDRSRPPPTEIEKEDNEFCDLFVKDNWDVLSLAAFIILTLNSITGLRHRRHDDDLTGSHDHQSCPEYQVANVVHTILENMRTQNKHGYADKIRKLFEVMTSDRYWKESMHVITHYLRLPADSPGTKTAWALSTNEGSSNPVGAPGAFRKRWLMLLFLNVYKCRSCKKPRPWFLTDLLDPMWVDLGIASVGELEINLLRDFLERDFAIKLKHTRSYH